MLSQTYRGRFAPSPTGPLHAGSLVAALASWLDARAHGGAWLVRIEDVDTPRCKAEYGELILQQLGCLGLQSDEPVLWQSTRRQAYDQALQTLKPLTYFCTCTRAQLAALKSLKSLGADAELQDKGRCAGAGHSSGALRIQAPAQDGEPTIADFVLRRADGCTSYQLAVVVDDGAQGITHIVRGADLESNTPRQIWLQRALGLPQPHYAHTPLVLAADGKKLSKQNGAAPLALATEADRLQTLATALGFLGLQSQGQTSAELLEAAIRQTASRTPDWRW